MKHLITICLVAACAERIGPSPNDNPDAMPGVDGDSIMPTGRVTTITSADGTSTTLVDCTSTDEWTYVDIEQFTATDESSAWDLRCQRFHISTGTGTDVAPLDVPFANVTEAPASGWLVDADTDGDGTIDFAFEQGDGWYDYNADTHVLTPKPLTWVVRSTTATIKLRIEKYYDTAGTAGWFTLTWRPL